MTSYEDGSDNVVSFQHVGGARVRVHWSGKAFVHGIGGESFDLDAVATLTKVSLSAQIGDESEVDDDASRQIFETVFPNGDFEQHPAAEVDKFEEDGVVYLSFDANFTPAE